MVDYRSTAVSNRNKEYVHKPCHGVIDTTTSSGERRSDNEDTFTCHWVLLPVKRLLDHKLLVNSCSVPVSLY
jgi:hypothetical protein